MAEAARLVSRRALGDVAALAPSSLSPALRRAALDRLVAFAQHKGERHGDGEAAVGRLGAALPKTAMCLCCKCVVTREHVRSYPSPCNSLR
jgi:hypothetical protein